jgi:hypothetical protein
MIGRSTNRQKERKKIGTVRQQRERNFVGKIIEEARSFKINEIEIFIFGEKIKISWLARRVEKIFTPRFYNDEP